MRLMPTWMLLVAVAAVSRAAVLGHRPLIRVPTARPNLRTPPSAECCVGLADDAIAASATTVSNDVEARSATTVRLVNRSDLFAAATLLYDAFAVSRQPASWLVAVATKARLALDIEQRMTPWDWGRHAQLIAEDSSGRPLGFVEVWGEDATALSNRSSQTPQPVLFNLCVASGARRAGVARLLVERSEDECRSWGDEEVYLKVREDNLPAGALYERSGYELVETRGPAELPAWQERWKGDGGAQPLQLLRKGLASAERSASIDGVPVPAKQPRDFAVNIDTVLAYGDPDALVWFTMLILRNTGRLTPTYRVLPAAAALVTWLLYCAIMAVLSTTPSPAGL